MSINLKKFEKILKSQNMLDFQFFFNLNKSKDQQTNLIEIKYYLNLIPSNRTNPLWWSAVFNSDYKVKENEYDKVEPVDYITNTFMDYLFEYGANINVKNTFGQTILMKACEEENITLINHLVNYNTIDINAVDDKHMSALHYACYNYNPILIKILINRSINTNIQDIHGWTAFHILLYCIKHPIKSFEDIKQIIYDCISPFTNSNLSFDVKDDKILNTHIIENPNKFIFIKNILHKMRLNNEF